MRGSALRRSVALGRIGCGGGSPILDGAQRRVRAFPRLRSFPFCGCRVLGIGERAVAALA